MRERAAELLRYRGLVAALVGRHLSTRYRGSALGFAWSFLNPLCLMAVYTLVFNYYIRFDDVPYYTVFLFCGLLPWTWTASALAEGTGSVVASGHLVTKAMFPAQVLPLVSVLTSLAHFVLSLPLLLLFLWASGHGVPWTVVYLPVVLAVHAAFLYGVSLVLGSLNVLYRDVQHLVANALSLLFFLCPVVYPVTTVPERFRWTLWANPFSLAVMLYQSVLFDGVPPSPAGLLWLGVWAAAAVYGGVAVYDRYRESFAELL